jgi:NitT/TauT family transport system permease protein/sulfonate transport system permease protein
MEAPAPLPDRPAPRTAAAAGRRDAQVRWAATLGALGLWWAAGEVYPDYLMPGPVRVAEEVAVLLGTPVLASHVLASLLHVGAAIAFGFAVGFALAVLAGFVPLFRLFVRERVTPFLSAFSGIGWTLLAVIWFGINPVTVIFAITVNLVPFYLINIGQGLDALDGDYVEMGRSFRRSGPRVFVLVMLPLLVPFLFASLRLAFGVAWKIALTAELLGGDRGLGYLMNLSMQEQNTPRILAIALFIVAFVYVAETWVLSPVQRALDRRYRTA